MSGPVGLIAKYVLLRERNVVKMLPLREGTLPDVDVKHIIFFTRPNLKLMDHIADNIHGEEKKRKKTSGTSVGKEFHLYFVPRLSQLCEKHLMIKGVYGSLKSVGELKCDIFPVDNDLLSIELNDTYR